MFSRSPKARLPTWSWFWMKETKASGGSSALGSPRGAAAIRHHLALIGEAFGERSAQLLGVAL